MLQALIRRPIVPTSSGPLLVLLHGLGANEHDLMGLERDFDPKLTIVCLRAPLEYQFGGFAWFEIQWLPDGIHVDPQQALQSLDILLETLRNLPSQLDLQPSQTFLGGFSQGAIMSLGASLAEPGLFDGVLLLSGRMLPEFAQVDPSPTFAKLPFYVQHGLNDQVLPVSGARTIKSFLESAGCPLTYLEYSMGHEINQPSLKQMTRWLNERIV